MPIHGGDGSSIGIISGGATVDYGKERVFFASHRTGNSSVIVYRSGLTKGTGVLSGARRIDVTMSITRIPL